MPDSDVFDGDSLAKRAIDYFESRLANIETMLRDLSVSINSSRSPSVSVPESGPASLGPGPAVSSPVGPETAGIVYGPDDDDDDLSVFEGDIPMTAFASEFLESTVTRALPHDLDPDIRSALASLQQIVSMQNKPNPHESRFPNAKPLPKGGLRELPMPPAHVVIATLREVKDVPLVSFTNICTFIATDNFPERCSKVYFATEDYSLMTWGIVNAGLYFLFQERASLAQGAQRTQLLEYQCLCRDNLETALSSLPLLMPPRKESIEVLLLGAFYAIEASKFSVARDLNSIAATICQTLGYHRIRSPTPESEPKAVLFWSSYLLDKALSIRSGRAPVIQDYDITVPRRLGDETDVSDTSWRVILNQWVSYADFLGRAYEQLYSPAALARPQEQRAESARQLVQTMLNLAKEQEPLIQHTREKVRGTKFDDNTPFPVDMSILGDELMNWAALTLVYRAIPSPPGSPSTFNAECIHAARKAFACHQEYMEMAGDSLATSDEADLRRLADFVESLQPACATSEAVAKLHRICQVLHNVASLCIRAKAQRQQDPHQRDQDMTMVGNNIDMYLSQLGFMPQFGGGQQQPAVHGAAAPFEGDLTAAEFNASQANELGNWFSGNTHIMGLVEEDLSEFEPRMWPGMGGGQ
ncbi:hypothetical protein N0V88_003412 [Collariella sp. IMI 366227]|nr:hypothetical protein N0V88_003412 [Collariella sp. IMI 366227]